MSNVEPAPPEIHHRHHGATGVEVISSREVPLGGPRAMTVRRTLPHRDRSLIGAWCFADHYGPAPGPMDVPPHPHTSLQTVTWLFSGSVEHRDSLGTHQWIKPGEMNLMTSGHGISHSEVSAPDSEPLHGVQLWVALPDGAATGASSFVHYEPPLVDLSTLDDARVTGHAEARLFLGALGSLSSPVETATPLLGAQIDISPGGTVEIDVQPSFEHGVLVDRGTIAVNGESVEPSSMAYIPTGQDRLVVSVSDDQPARIILLGGEPFTQDIIMWWNFVGRTHQEIVQARQDWQDRAARFGQIDGYDGPTAWLPAPALPPVTLKARRRREPQ